MGAEDKGKKKTPRIRGGELLAKYGKQATLGGAIFVTTERNCAKDVEDCGKDAVYLKSREEYEEFVSEAEREAPNCSIVFLLNCPCRAGETDELKDEKSIAEELEERGIFYDGPIDPLEYRPLEDLPRLEWLEKLKENLDGIQEKALDKQRKWIDERAQELGKNAVARDIDEFVQRTLNGRGTSPVPTGWATLDERLDGGLYPGLYSIGAISALGKTTFVLQLADQIAAAGEREVLFFSLEMDKRELMAKSISRNTYRLDPAHGENAKTTRGILTGRFAPEDPKRSAERELFMRAAEEYRKAAAHIHVFEGVGNIGIDEIRTQVAKYRRYTGTAPVVIVDYMQILAPADIRATDKQNTDKAVLELKRISRDFETPVIAVSSFNRDNYTAPVNTASFKESGAIEYSADVLIGLQYEGMEYKEGESDGARQKRIRELTKDMRAKSKSYKSPQKIELRILKNRNGEAADIVFEEIPMFNYFRDTGKLSETFETPPVLEWE